MSVLPVDVVTELSRRFRAGDRDGAFQLFHPDIRIDQPASLPHGGTHHGTAGVQAMGAAFDEHWDRTIEQSRIVGGDDVVVQITTQTWTAKATGKSATVDVVELLSVAGDLVTEIRVFPQDTGQLLATLQE